MILAQNKSPTLPTSHIYSCTVYHNEIQMKFKHAHFKQPHFMTGLGFLLRVKGNEFAKKNKLSVFYCQKPRFTEKSSEPYCIFL